jgi:hypothetical protein
MLTPTMRAWLEDQQNYFLKSLEEAKNRRKKHLKTIKNHAQTVRDYNKNIKEAVSMVVEISGMLEQEDWEL